MRGRRPDPAAIQEAKGNPGHRPRAKSAVKHEEELPQADSAARVLPFKIPASAKKVHDLVGPQLRAINMLRPTDEPAFWRYCDTMASYWGVTEKLQRLGGATYKCKTTTGETMHRIRPEFIVQERLARRLDTLEDRFGLTPMARQQYLLALMRNPQGQLPLSNPRSEQPDDEMPIGPEPMRDAPPAVGGLRALN